MFCVEKSVQLAPSSMLNRNETLPGMIMESDTPGSTRTVSVRFKIAR